MEQCSLCLQYGVLRKSHLIPKSVYKTVGKLFPEKRESLVQVTEKGALYTDRQVSIPLLCADCEELFSKKGEQVVCKECYGGKGNFILRDKLKATSEIFTEGSKGWINPAIDAENTKLNYKAYLYFGASIIWRTSVGKWPQFRGTRRGCLGIYEEKIRRYLIGEIDFPSKVSLLIAVNNNDEQDHYNSLILFPNYAKMEGFHGHYFFIPGMVFFLMVGRMSGKLERMYREENTSILFVENSLKTEAFLKTIPKGIFNAKGRLARKLDKVENS
ncbi:MAG: hypothetical protein OXI72_12575 [Gemmatimonadota bacterium]|nr:hypothetical protein [Gemmatimonadota bacterium]